jgi:hypothetical protein
MPPAEREALLAELEAAGLDTRDFGRFVNRVVPGVIEPSTFDAERATPILLRWLPRVGDRRLKESVVGHLKTKATDEAGRATRLGCSNDPADEQAKKWGDGGKPVARHRTLMPVS